MWSRRYFGASVGAVNETQIKQYIDDQSDDAGFFKICDEHEPEDTEL
ncbi:MAG: transposase [Bacteroidales bacterium]|nr:transposase [Bacteroidales bacterium]